MADSFVEVIRITAENATAAGIHAAEAALSRLKSISSIPLRIVDMATAPIRSIFGLLQQVGLAAMGVKAIVDGVKDLVAPAVEFQSAFTRIAALTTSSADDMEVYRKGIEEVARLTGRSDVELANATFFIASAGLKGADAINTLTASAKASAAGLGDTKVVADAVTSALNAYRLASTDATHVTDLLTNAVVQGKMEPAALAQSLGRILPIASAVGVSLEQVLASMSTMTRVGLDADNAATALRGVLAALESPGATATAALEQIGYSANRLRNSIKERGLLATLEDMMKRTHGNIDVLSEIIPNIRALTGVLATAGSQSQAYNEILGSMQNATGRTDKAFETMAQTAQHNFDVLGVAWDQFREAIGVEIIPGLIPIVQGFGNWLQDNAAGFAKAGAAFGEELPYLQAIASAIWREVQPAMIALVHNAGDVWQFTKSQLIPVLGDFWQWLGPKLGDAASTWNKVTWPMLLGVWEHIRDFITNTLLPKLKDVYEWVYPKIDEAVTLVSGSWLRLQALMDGVRFPDLQTPDWIRRISVDFGNAGAAFSAFSATLDNIHSIAEDLDKLGITLSKLDPKLLYAPFLPLLPILLPINFALDHMDFIVRTVAGATELLTAAIDKFLKLLIWIQDNLPRIGELLSAFGTIVRGIADDLTLILGKIPQLPGMQGAGPQLLPEIPPTITSDANANAGAQWGGGSTTRHAIPHQSGGWLTEPIIGQGLDTGRYYSFVENRHPEYVSPAGASMGGRVTLSMTVEKGAVQINGANGPADAWATGADEFWIEVSRRLKAALSNRNLGVGR